jgi:uncharacterized phage protein (TIGR01671 family)
MNQNRILKFRVWCKVSNRYEYNWQKVISSHLNYRDEKCHNGIDATSDDLLVFQQFTGLKDENDREIYEGDILEQFDNSKLRSQIIFKDGMFCDGENSLIAFARYSKIIGNIFENPELIQS